MGKLFSKTINESSRLLDTRECSSHVFTRSFKWDQNRPKNANIAVYFNKKRNTLELLKKQQENICESNSQLRENIIHEKIDIGIIWKLKQKSCQIARGMEIRSLLQKMFCPIVTHLLISPTRSELRPIMFQLLYLYHLLLLPE